MIDLRFKELRARDVAGLRVYFGRRTNFTCDSTIFDSFLWQDYFHLRYAVWEDKALFLLLEENDVTFAEVPFCDDAMLPEAWEILEHYFRDVLKKPFLVRWADEHALSVLNLAPEQYETEEVPDLADYVYDAEKLRTLSGKKYHKKKNHLNAFLKEYEGRWEYRRMHRWSRNEIWNFLQSWEEDKDNVEEHLEAEMTGLHHYLFNMDVFDARMAGIYIDGKLEAFTIGSYNQPDQMAIVHVEKANPDIRGLYVAINREFQANEFPDALYVNREDDVGLPALRKAKESYHPVFMAKKYDVRKRESHEVS